jgi:hypothetical protein
VRDISITKDIPRSLLARLRFSRKLITEFGGHMIMRSFSDIRHAACSGFTTYHAWFSTKHFMQEPIGSSNSSVALPVYSSNVYPVSAGPLFPFAHDMTDGK